MKRGKIRIRVMKNPIRRKNLFLQMRCGLFTEADELSALCGAQISMFVVAEKGKCFNYTSPSISTKDVIDRYQRTRGIDLWSELYERMEEDLKKLKETNMSLQRQIGQRTSGESLGDLSFEELNALEREMEDSLRALRERKLKRLESLKENLSTGRVDAMDDPIYGVVENGGVYDYGVHHIDALIQLPNQPNHEGQTESCLTNNSSVSQ